MASSFRVTFSRDGHKKPKNRKFLDGFVTQAGRDAKLYDEGGAVVALARLPAGEVLEEGCELDNTFGQSVIVHMDEPCDPSEIGGEANNACQPGSGPTAATGTAAAAALMAAVTTGVGGPWLAASGARKKPGRKPAFKAPRLDPATATAAMAAPSIAAHDQPVAAPLQLCCHQFLPPPSVTSLQPAAMQQPTLDAAPAPGTAFSSDDDILRLLTGEAPLHKPPREAPPVEAAAVAPVAKQPRVQPPTSNGGGGGPATSFGGAGAWGECPTLHAASPPVASRLKPRRSRFVPGDKEGDGYLGAQHAAGVDAWSPPLGIPPNVQQPWQRRVSVSLLAAAAAQQQESQRRSTWRGEGQGAVAAAAETGVGGTDELNIIPSSWGGGIPGTSHPVVRPPQAAPLVAQPSGPPKQPGWQSQQQRAPFQPNRQPLAVPPLPQQGSRLGPAGGGGSWKAPAVVAAGAAGDSASKQAAGPVQAQRAPSSPAPSTWNRLLDGVVQLGWPCPEESARPVRRVAVPDSFTGGQQYVRTWSNALWEELNLRIAEVAQVFHAAMARAGQPLQQQQQPGHGRKWLGRSKGGQGVGGGLEAQLRQALVPYYGSCELFIWRNNLLPKKGGWNGGGGSNKRGKLEWGSADISEEEYGGRGEEEAAVKPENIYLILKSGRQRATEYRRDDLWIISSTPDFRPGFAPGQPGDRSREPWTAVARSLWHGPNQDGKFEIEFLSARPPGLGRSQAVHAIKGPDASTELGMIDLLHSGAAATLPLLPHLLLAQDSGSAAATSLRPTPWPGSSVSAARWQQQQQPAKPDSPSYSCSDDDEALAAAAAAADGLVESPLVQADQLIKRFGLNEEQGEVLTYVAGWASAVGSTSGAPPPICLVHGPFGSGKSTLLVALLHFILLQRGRAGSPLAGARILVSAHTNVAVDRVLLGLLESGYSEFLRVGPLRRISRRLLPQSLHASESRITASAAAELREMVKEASGSTEAAAIRAELAAAEKGSDRQRKRLLKTVPVVGVTCCSSTLAALDGHHFDVLVLDESSQMVEPLSAVPLLRAQARFLIAAGDPLQLPPVIASPAHVTPVAAVNQSRPTQQQEQVHGLLRPLFVRLTALGLPPFLLRRQYRCHPDISAVPNAHFYGGRLLDGCSREQRASLLPGLPSVAFLDVRGQESYSAGRSASNQAEAEAVVAAVQRLVAAGVELGQCGIICFFRAQVALVRSLLDRRLPQLEQQRRRQPTASAAWAGGGTSSSCEAHPLPVHDLKGTGRGQGGGGEDVEAGVNEEPQEEERQLQQGIQVATVDSFQGAECDIILLTTAVTRPGPFASDACRLNVALTRAKCNLLIVGCAPALQQSAPAFAALLAQCRGTPAGYHPSGRLSLAIGAAAGCGQAAAEQVPVRPAWQPVLAAAAAAPLFEDMEEEDRE